MKRFKFLRTSVLVSCIAFIGFLGCTKFDPTPWNNRLNELEGRVEALETQCNKMNTNIASLQAAVDAINNQDHVTKVEPLMEDSKLVGYTIYFAKANPIVIYSSTTPIVTPKEDSGSYYWAVNGEFLLDDAGNRIAVGDGVTPELKVEDGKWLVSCDNGKSWIEVGDVVEDANISVSQDADYVYITFNGETFVLPKSPASAEEEMFAFEINEVTASSVNMNVMVADDELRYCLMCVEKEFADLFESDEELFQDDLAYMSEYLEYGYTLEDIIGMFTSIGDVFDMTISQLEANTEYLIYAYGLELDGTRTTDIYREYVTTKNIEKVNVTFDIDAQVAGSSVDVTVTPSDNNVYYYFDAIDVESVQSEFGGDIAEAAKYFIDYNLMLGNAYGMTAEEVILEIASQGQDHYLFEMEAETEYIIFAMAVSTDGKVISDVTTKNVTSGKVEPSDNVITLNVDSTTTSSVTVSTTATNDDPYFLGIEPAAYFNGMSDEEIMASIIESYGSYINYSIENGNVDGLELIGLDPGTEYLLMAFGVQSGTATTALVKQLVSTDAGSDPALCTFDIDIADLSSSSANITVTPSADDVRYLWNVVEAGYSDEDLLAVYNAEIEEYLAAEYITSALEYWKQMSYTGVDAWEYEDLAPSTEYEVFVAAIDMNAEKPIVPFVRKSFTTLAADASSVPARAAQSSLIKRETRINDTTFSGHRSVKKQSQNVQEDNAAPMRNLDFQNANKTAPQIERSVRHSAFNNR